MKNNGLTLLVIIIIVLAAYYAANTGGKPVQASRPGAAGGAIVPRQDDITFDVEGAPSVSALFISNVLCSANQADRPAVSPACGTGQALYDLGVKYGIDPVYALAWFTHESSQGRYGIAHDNLGLGNIRCTSGYACKNGFRAYASWAEGYEDWYRLIRAYIAGQINGYPCKTVAEIVPVYAPPSENNTQGYIHEITRMVTTWRQEASR